MAERQSSFPAIFHRVVYSAHVRLSSPLARESANNFPRGRTSGVKSARQRSTPAFYEHTNLCQCIRGVLSITTRNFCEAVSSAEQLSTYNAISQVRSRPNN